MLLRMCHMSAVLYKVASGSCPCAGFVFTCDCTGQVIGHASKQMLCVCCRTASTSAPGGHCCMMNMSRGRKAEGLASLTMASK